MTVADLIKNSLRKLGVIQTGETPAAAELNDGLGALNAMLDSWGLEGLVIYDVARQTFALTAAATYKTIGSGGDFAVVRPNRIERAGLIPSGQTLETPIEVLTDQKYASIADKALTGIPRGVWPEMTFPLAKLYTWPIPTAADTLVLYTWMAIPRFAAITDTISLPPGYERALTYNLAVEVSPEYDGVSAEVAAIAVESKAAIKRINDQPMEMRCDGALLNRNGQGYVDSIAFRSGI